MSAEGFAQHLRAAEDRLRACGLSGRAAYAALTRHLARRLDLPPHLWLEGPDAPPQAALDRIPLTAELDLFGLAYERFFPELFKGERGQYFTPRPLVELMVDLAELRPGDRVLDPACGSGSFLVAAHSRGAEVDGIEVDPELVALCQLNLALLKVNPRAVRQADLFRDTVRASADPDEERWDVILANPPFSVVQDDPAVLATFALAEGKRAVSSDILFVEAAFRRLRPGGRMVVVLPHSVLVNPRFAALRDWMGERFVRRAILSLPEGVFRPFGGAASRAAVLSLQKRPAELRPWVFATITEPGFDPHSKVYRRTEPDEFALVRLAWRARTLASAASDEPSWSPDALRSDSGMGGAVPRVALGMLAEVVPGATQPSDQPDQSFTEIDLADVDKGTGEVTRARARQGSEFSGPKASFEDGDILFSRMRPELNNVVWVRRPDQTLPRALRGSSEWVRLWPVRDPGFALLAARSSFARAQLVSTGGQTRPRVRAEELPELLLPDPGAALRARLSSLLEEAHVARQVARARMDRIAALYEAFGRGEIDATALAAALDALPSLRSDPASAGAAPPPPPALPPSAPMWASAAAPGSAPAPERPPDGSGRGGRRRR